MSAVVYFDGVCNLCNSTVQFIIARDPKAYFKFATLQTENPDSVVLIEDDQTYTRSTAALRIARRLRFPWPIFAIFLAVPRPIRDAVYKFIATHRYQWFGKRDSCMLPTPALRDRFMTTTVGSSGGADFSRQPASAGSSTSA